MKLLEMNHVKKSFDGLMVIQDISLSVEKGRLFPLSARPVQENLPFCAARPCWKPWTAGS